MSYKNLIHENLYVSADIGGGCLCVACCTETKDFVSYGTHAVHCDICMCGACSWAIPVESGLAGQFLASQGPSQPATWLPGGNVNYGGLCINISNSSVNCGDVACFYCTPYQVCICWVPQCCLVVPSNTCVCGLGAMYVCNSSCVYVCAGQSICVDSYNGYLKLVGDSATPGSCYYYGTDYMGTRGWYCYANSSPLQCVNAQSPLVESTSSGISCVCLRYTGSLEQDITGCFLQLHCDCAAPGSSQYYGTDCMGVKGWTALPAGLSGPGGGCNAIQFGMNGCFCGASNFTYNCSTCVVEVIGTVNADIFATCCVNGVTLSFQDAALVTHCVCNGIMVC